MIEINKTVIPEGENRFPLINDSKIHNIDLYMSYQKGEESFVEFSLCANLSGIDYAICDFAGNPIIYKYNGDFSGVIPVKDLPICDILLVKVNFNGGKNLGILKIKTKR